MHSQRALIDVYNKRMMWIGPGGYKITLSPGSKVLPLENAPSGHLLLPCTEWQKAASTDDLKKKDITLICNLTGIEMESDAGVPASSL